MTDNVKVPVVCMLRDFQALSFIEKRIKMNESCALVGMHGYGKDIIYEELVKTNSTKILSCEWKTINATDSDKLKAFIHSIKTDFRGKLIINLSTRSDESWLFDKLDDLRLQNNATFVSVVFSNKKEVQKALERKNKSLYRSLYILPNATDKDIRILIKDFIRRFDYSPSEEQIDNIVELSGGHIGLVKSLYLLLVDNASYNLSIDNLLKEPSIIYRIDSFFDDFTNAEKKLLSDNKYSEILKLLHAINENNKTISPLIDEYIRNTSNTNSKEKKLFSSFTKKEAKVFAIFENNLNTIMTRHEIADVIWGLKVDEKYTDWALDQIIYRLRNKLKENASSYKLLTKKGRGFVLQRA
ncbi:winged helix-turn-helix domain-containing protein [Candidatus Woesebacteria bacterium]|nr:MAG: winged helix-turn-helix domain-containing protein [Candidatus Woesebacteria bacterium]